MSRRYVIHRLKMCSPRVHVANIKNTVRLSGWPNCRLRQLSPNAVPALRQQATQGRLEGLPKAKPTSHNRTFGPHILGHLERYSTLVSQEKTIIAIQQTGCVVCSGFLKTLITQFIMKHLVLPDSREEDSQRRYSVICASTVFISTSLSGNAEE